MCGTMEFVDATGSEEREVRISDYYTTISLPVGTKGRRERC